MIQPVVYYQTDPRWKNTLYAVKDEKSTIGSAGCGPTAMAMVLATWADPSVNPKTEASWALSHGYKCYGNGTYYSYFTPAAARYNLVCKQLNWTTIYKNSSSVYHERVRQAIKDDHLVIACMGQGTWTSGGHFVLVYNIDGNTIYINDPASTRAARTQGNYTTFKNEVKYYFLVENPKYNANYSDYYARVTAKEGLNCRSGAGTVYNSSKLYSVDEILHITKENNGWGYTGEGWVKLQYTTPITTNLKPEEDVDNMTIEEFINNLTDEQAYKLVSKAMNHAGKLPESGWSVKEGGMTSAAKNKIINGGAPRRMVTREELAAILSRLNLTK